MPYFVYSTCTGAVGISLNWGMAGSRGAATSLVQQHDEARTAVALTAMASSKRIMVGLVCLVMDFMNGLDCRGLKKTPPGSETKRAGLRPHLLGWFNVSWSGSCTLAAGRGEKGCDGGDDCKFDQVHDVVLYLVVVGNLPIVSRLLLVD